jgi:hypothetical protein
MEDPRNSSVAEFPKKWSGVGAPKINFFSTPSLALTGVRRRVKVASKRAIATLRYFIKEV